MAGSIISIPMPILIQSGENTQSQDMLVSPVTFKIMKAKSSAFESMLVSMVVFIGFINPLLNLGCRLI